MRVAPTWVKMKNEERKKRQPPKGVKIKVVYWIREQ